MTTFDWVAAGLLAISALVGLARGGVREIAGLGALLLAALAALIASGPVAPLVGQAVRPMWLATTLTMAGLFVITYIVIRLAGAVLARGVRSAGLGGADRLLGLTVGLVRGLAVLGLFALAVETLAPPPHVPGWTGRSRLYPLAAGAGDVLRAAAPAILAGGAHSGRPQAGARRADGLVVVEDRP